MYPYLSFYLTLPCVLSYIVLVPFCLSLIILLFVPLSILLVLALIFWCSLYQVYSVVYFFFFLLVATLLLFFLRLIVMSFLLSFCIVFLLISFSLSILWFLSSYWLHHPLTCCLSLVSFFSFPSFYYSLLVFSSPFNLFVLVLFRFLSFSSFVVLPLVLSYLLFFLIPNLL